MSVTVESLLLQRREDILAVRDRLATLIDAIETARAARAEWEAQEHPFGEAEWEALDKVHGLEEQLIRAAAEPEQVRFLKAVLAQVAELAEGAE
jgi:hypothetical protein